MNDELESWLRLVHGAGLGREQLRRLLAAFGSARAVLEAPAEARLRLQGPQSRQARAIDSEVEQRKRLDGVQAWLESEASRRIVTLADAEYPQWLLQTVDPPLLLYLEGQIECLRCPALAIVGSRQATPQGLLNARAFAREIGGQGWAIVSGLAAGIDAAAHQGALDVGAPTIAVVGTGLDQIYPAANRSLAGQIVVHGLLISEYALGTPPRPVHFPQRNRIIAGLARGTLVVEATARSGSLITARLACEAGREVFAIPGSIHSPQSKGCHALLRQGAKLVETAEDVLEELTAPPAARDSSSVVERSPGITAAADEADPVLRALGHDPATLDALMARCGWPADLLNVRLLELEFAGEVTRLPGGLFQRVSIA